MSTRLIIQNTTGNEMQLFGNNDVPPEIIKELERQELEFTQDPEYSPRQWNINEIQPIVNIIKDRFYKMLKTNKKVVDFSNYFYEKKGNALKKKEDIDLLLSTSLILENSYLFELHNLIEFLWDDIDWTKSSTIDEKIVLKENADVVFLLS